MLDLSGLSGRKILLIESDQFIRDALKISLLSRGCSLTTANSAMEGLNLIEENFFDVIICDFELSGMNGFEFYKLASGYCKKSIKIMIIGYGDIDPMSKVFKYGVNDIVEKPFPFELLLYKISKHLKA
jgi:DNA-binding NtrC family response regulator